MALSRFGRVARVTLQNAGAPHDPAINLALATQFQGLRIVFRAEKSVNGSPNVLDLEIYNLSIESRARLAQKDGIVVLEAGYQGDLPHLPIVFRGLMQQVDHRRDGPHWITHLQAFDGLAGYRDSFASLSFSAGVSWSQVAVQLAKVLQSADPSLNIGAFLDRVNGGALPELAQQFTSGYAFQGPAWRELEKLLRGAGYLLSSQDGKLEARKTTPKANETTTNVVELSPASGLIGSPEHGRAAAPGVPTTVHARSLLQPRILPLDLVVLSSSQFQRVALRAERVTHSGDTHGSSWETELELRLIPEIKVSLSAGRATH